ncbi:MAG: ABATE domain-containing protein [Hyphomicrobiales bacterium]|nr:ABATE domain-containing protein [Hyphomicrobiales bacterium]
MGASPRTEISKSPDLKSRAGALPLIAGGLALDFANTQSGRGGKRAIEHLGEDDDVVAWSLHAGLIDEGTAKRVRARLSRKDREFAGFLCDALALREAVHQVIVAVARGMPPAEKDLSHLAACCASALAEATLEMGEEGARWRWPTQEPVPETILGPIALSAIGILRESDPKRLKQCSGEHCGWVFFDMTKNRSRRWCEMSVCGNRAKASAHYRRSKIRAEAVAADEAPRARHRA